VDNRLEVVKYNDVLRE